MGSSSLLGRIQPLNVLTIPTWRAFVLEIFLIYMLIYVYLAVTKQFALRVHTPLIIGEAYAMLGLLELTILGNTLLFWPTLLLAGQHMMTLIAGFIGAALASMFYRYLKYQEETKSEATQP